MQRSLLGEPEMRLVGGEITWLLQVLLSNRGMQGRMVYFTCHFMNAVIKVLTLEVRFW